MRRRVVITGMGAITPIGLNVNDFWKNIKEGVHGIGPITYFDTTDYKAKLAAEVKGFDTKIIWTRNPPEEWSSFHSLQ